MTQTTPEAAICNAWAAHGGVGEPPLLYVTQKQFDAFVKAGVPAHRLRVHLQLPVGNKQ